MMQQDLNTAIDDLADRLLRLYLEADPLEATLLGIRDLDAKLTDLSLEAEHALTQRSAELRAAARAIDPVTLSEQAAITRKIVIALSEYTDNARAAQTVEYTVAAFPVSPSSVLLAYLRMTVLTNEQEAADYLLRLRSVAPHLEQAQQRLADGRARGLTPVAHLVTMAIEQIDLFMATEPCPLAVQAPTDHTDADQWTAERDSIIADIVKPAFASYRRALETDVLPTARSRDAVGLVHLPDGSARYRDLVRYHTTTERTPEELHQIGLDRIAQVHAEFVQLGGELFGLDDLHAIFARLNEDPDLRWTSAQEIVNAAEAAVRRAEVASRDWFGRLPATDCVLEEIPEIEAEGSAPAYYMPPALDGSRPGTYYTNVNRPTERTSFDLEATAFHEAVPGHHFQISIALETPDLPLLRRLPFFTAYVEGWGLYSERLADQMGLYSSPLQRMGMLSADAWRASRLVVDTGMHAMGWTREQAVDYMRVNTAVAPIDIEAEIDRYIALPAQALSYMTGRIEIEALRAKAKDALGDGFDIRSFHDTVLAAGALPLGVLAEFVDDWIATRPA